MADDRASAGLDTRQVALDLLLAVLSRRRTIESAIEAHRGFARLAARDRAFARNLLATTLRRLGQIDSVIEAALETPLPGKAERACFAMRLGICQLLFLGTPPHAAVATSVALTELGAAPFKALVNAVLRRVARNGLTLIADQDAERLNTPSWLWDRWQATYGFETCRRIAAAHLAEAPLDLSLKFPGDAAIWADRLDARILPNGTLRRAGVGSVTELAGYAEGAWWVQDAAAAMPVRLLGDIRGRTVIDLCAAPGGKTAQLAATGARVIAIERSPLRAQRLAENLSRLRLQAEIVVEDATKWCPTELADVVLLDAPCTATGTIRRHPDVPHLRSFEDIRLLVAAQKRLLDAAAAIVRPGGVLMYGVCSLEPEEGAHQVSGFLGRNTSFVHERIELNGFGGSEMVDNHGDLRTVPYHWHRLGGLDGFYASRLRRRLD